MRTFLRSSLTLVAATVCVAASAQTMVAKDIHFVGGQQSPEELLKLSGLTPGATLSKGDIEAAMQRLDRSGLFQDIEYSTDGTTLTFQLQPIARSATQRVIYENLVWFRPEQLNDAIHARVPLFNGTVPADSNLKVEVADAITALLKERGVEAKVAGRDMPGERYEYSVVSPSVVVTDLQIGNVHWESDAVLTEVRRAQLNQEYLEGITQRAVHDNLAYALNELGYLDATVSAISHGEPKQEPKQIDVVMTGSAEPGPRYRVAQVTLPAPIGSIKPAEFESDQQVKPGGLPAPSLVKNTTAHMAFVFAEHGYLDARASVAASKDSAAHTVSYTYTVEPGEVYHMRDLLFAADLNPGQRAQITSSWKLPPGAVYDGQTVGRSLAGLKTLCGAHPPLHRLRPDLATHQVDVALSCVPIPGQ